METKNKNNNKGEITLDGLAEIIQKEFESVRGEISEVRGEINEVREELKEKFYLVLDGQDKAAKWREDQETENTMSVAANRRHQDKLDNHEERIRTVENKLGVVRAAG